MQADPFHFPTVSWNVSTAQASKLFYHASTAWMDHQIGRVLDGLEGSGLANDTLVVLHSDHGWSLGEHGQWQKFTNWEVGVRTPMMIRAPWLPESRGRRSDALVELVDMYRTQADLAGITVPADEQIDGTSLGPILRGPDNVTVREAALSQFPRCPTLGDDFGPWETDTSKFWEHNWCETVDRSMIPWMGYSIRTKRWRYTEWAAWNGKELRADWSKPLAGRELYDHQGDDGSDFNAFENHNLANASEYASTVAALSKQLRALVAHPDGPLR